MWPLQLFTPSTHHSSQAGFWRRAPITSKISLIMGLIAADITIAVTVFSRRIFCATPSEAHSTRLFPSKVIVVEDCGPDATLREFVLKEFGERIEYFRNPKNRGCSTTGTPAWNTAAHRGFPFCTTTICCVQTLSKPCWLWPRTRRSAPCILAARQHLRKTGGICPPSPVSWKNNRRDIDVIEFADECLVFFPGQLFRVADARDIGGFRKASYFTGDWDLWFRLALKSGAAQTAAEVSVMRSHEGLDRGTSIVLRKGWKWALDNVQRKRNLALLKEKGIAIPFERAKLLEHSPIPSRWLFRRADGFSKRMRVYNWWLFTRSKPPHFAYAILQWHVRLLGPCALRFAPTTKNQIK